MKLKQIVAAVGMIAAVMSGYATDYHFIIDQATGASWTPTNNWNYL